MKLGDDIVFNCPECGTEVLEGAEGCSGCGTKLEWDGENNWPILSAGDDERPYLPNAGRGRLAQRALKVCATLAGLQILLAVLAVLGALNSKPATGLSAFDVIDRAPGVLEAALFYLLAQVFTAVVFLSWLHRAFSNLDALGTKPGKYTPGSAVSGFLIPIVNLHRPIGVMKELWDRSMVSPDIRTTTEKRIGTKEIDTWWMAYLASHALSLVTLSSLFIGNFTRQLFAAGGEDCAIHCLAIASALMLVRIIAEVNHRQESSSKQLVSEGKLKLTGQGA